MSERGVVTDAVLGHAYMVMAGIIRDNGEKYLPIFKRLHEEMERRKAANDLKDIALQVAAGVIE